MKTDTPPATPDLPPVQVWLKKEAAAARLGKTTRTVLNLASAGAIRSKRELDPDTGQDAVFVSQEDIDERAGAARRPTQVVDAGHDLDAAREIEVRSPERDHVAIILAQLVRQLTAPPATSNDWFTLDEAVAYLHGKLPASTLRAAIHDGSLPVRLGVPVKQPGEKKARPGSSWRIAKADLDALRGLPHGRGVARATGA